MPIPIPMSIYNRKLFKYEYRKIIVKKIIFSMEDLKTIVITGH